MSIAEQLREKLAKQLAADDLFRVRSVVSMAPASPRGDPITGLDTVGHLLLYGTRDFDTPPTATFREFDVSGSNGSQLDPEWDSSVNYKAMKLLTNGAHTGYSDLGTPEQKSTVKGYILAFLSAHNKNDVTWYEDYIRGEQVPGDWPPPVFTSYSDGFLQRVIDNFDDGYLAKAAETTRNSQSVPVNRVSTK